MLHYNMYHRIAAHMVPYELSIGHLLEAAKAVQCLLSSQNICSLFFLIHSSPDGNALQARAEVEQSWHRERHPSQLLVKILLLETTPM